MCSWPFLTHGTQSSLCRQHGVRLCCGYPVTTHEVIVPGAARKPILRFDPSLVMARFAVRTPSLTVVPISHEIGKRQFMTAVIADPVTRRHEFSRDDRFAGSSHLTGVAS